jgi:hypothetical protein
MWADGFNGIYPHLASGLASLPFRPIRAALDAISTKPGFK